MNIKINKAKSCNDGRTVALFDREDVDWGTGDESNFYTVEVLLEALELAQDEWTDGDKSQLLHEVKVILGAKKNDMMLVVNENTDEAIAIAPVEP